MKSTFLTRIINDGGKCIIYNRINRKRYYSKLNEPSQTISRAELHKKKMLLIWWDYKSVVYLEMLSRKQTIRSDKYCQQLRKRETVIKVKWPELTKPFIQDNDWPHTSLQTRQKLLELGSEVLSHPPYTSDVAHQITIYLEDRKILWMVNNDDNLSEYIQERGKCKGIFKTFIDFIGFTVFKKIIKCKYINSLFDKWILRPFCLNILHESVQNRW